MYYEERSLKGTTRSDSGATLRDLYKALYSYGVCEEIYMPYGPTTLYTPPSTTALKNALKYKIKTY